MDDCFRHKHKITARRIFFAIALAGSCCLLNAGVASGMPPKAFQEGEKLLYKATWLWFDAGMVETAAPEFVSDDGKKFARFTIHTWTTNTIAHIFTMDDRFESLWDIDERVPVSYFGKVRETHTVRDKKMAFDQKSKLVTVQEDKSPEKVFPFRPNTQDFISASYVTRGHGLEPGEKVFIPVFEDNKNYDALIEVVRRERIPVLGGLMDTVVITGTLGFEGAFQKNKKVYLWLSDDEFHVPVKIQMRFAFGTVTLSLEKAEGVAFKLISVATK